MPSTTHIKKLYRLWNWEKNNTEYNLNLKISVLWEFMPYNLVNRYQRFGGACILRLQSSDRKVKFSWTTLKTEAAFTTATLPPLFFGLFWRSKQNVPAKFWFQFTKISGVTFNKTTLSSPVWGVHISKDSM